MYDTYIYNLEEQLEVYEVSADHVTFHQSEFSISVTWLHFKSSNAH